MVHLFFRLAPTFGGFCSSDWCLLLLISSFLFLRLLTLTYAYLQKRISPQRLLILTYKKRKNELFAYLLTNPFRTTRTPESALLGDRPSIGRPPERGHPRPSRTQ